MEKINTLREIQPNHENEPSTSPHNIEAEQALLGALLINNDTYDKIASIINSNHFFDPLHARIYDVIINRIEKNTIASPVSIKPYFEDDEGLKELGGTNYLAQLANASISIFAAREYAQMIYDMSLRRDLIIIGEEIVNKAQIIDISIEPNEQIVDAEQKLYSLSEKGGIEKGFQSFLSAVTDAVNVANAAYQRDGGLAGISTGFEDINKKLGGLHQSDLLILAGRPSMGKTSLATNIAFNIAKNYKKGVDKEGRSKTIEGGVVGFFSLEMSAEQLAGRILSEVAAISSHRIRSGDMSEDEFRRFVEAARDLENCPLYIDDTPALPISQLAARARRLKRTQGLDVLIIDYLQLIRSTTAKDNRVNEVSEITQGLKAIAKELNIPVIALSQLSRQVENRDDKRPQLSDLRESGSIEQDSDVVMFVYREEYYVERTKPDESNAVKMKEWQDQMAKATGKAELIISKQRHGPIGRVELSFQAEFTRFGNLNKTWQTQPTDFD